MVVQPYNHITIQGTTFKMSGQMYRGHTNAMALSSSPVVSALGSELDNPEKKMRALLLGLAKSICYLQLC